jgi:transcriptional regulator with XRE-family HTH domain
MTTGEQVKAARKLLGWSQQVLAGHVGVSEIVISNIERGRRVASEWIFRGTREVLEAAGVEFIIGTRPSVRLKGGWGVRLRKTAKCSPTDGQTISIYSTDHVR